MTAVVGTEPHDSPTDLSRSIHAASFVHDDIVHDDGRVRAPAACPSADAGGLASIAKPARA